MRIAKVERRNLGLTQAWSESSEQEADPKASIVPGERGLPRRARARQEQQKISKKRPRHMATVEESGPESRQRGVQKSVRTKRRARDVASE